MKIKISLMITVLLIFLVAGCKKEGDIASHLPENYVFVSQWGSKGTGVGQFNFPARIALDIEENLYVIDYCNRRIHKFTSSGLIRWQWGSEGEGEGQFLAPNAITVDSLNGRIYVVDNGRRIQKFTSDGGFITQWNVKFATSLTAVVFGNKKKHVYVYAGVNFDRIFEYNSIGEFIGMWCHFPSPPTDECGKRGYIYGVAATSKNNIITLYCRFMDAGLSHEFTIIESDPDGYVLRVWGSRIKKIDGNPGFTSIAVDKEDNIYMTDYENNCIWKFDLEGNLLARWGSKGSGEGQFNIPSGIAIDSKGNVYVADGKNNRIQKFRPE